MSAQPFGRLLTAMATPMTPAGELDLDATAALASYLVDQGNDGLVVNGTTGESATTTDAEKLELLRVVVDAVGDRAHVLAGVGTNDTAHTIELARQAATLDIDGLLVVTPYYNKPPQAGVLRHFTAVADATELPVMLYDIPGRAGIALATDTLIALAQHPRIVAVKDAKGDPWATTHVQRETDLVYYSGDDAATLPLVAQGAVGVVGVTTHVASRRYVDLIDAATSGDVARAIDLHRSLVPIVDAVMTVNQGAIMVKAALVELGVLGNAAVRSPLVEATEQEVALLRDALDACDLRDSGMAMQR